MTTKTKSLKVTIINGLIKLKLLSSLPSNISDNVIQAAGDTSVHAVQHAYKGVFEIIKAVTPVIESGVKQWNEDFAKYKAECEIIDAIVAKVKKGASNDTVDEEANS